MAIITQAEFARQIGKTPALVTKLKKQGLFDKALVKKNGKTYLDQKKAHTAYEKNLDPNYKSATPQIKNRKKKGNGEGTETLKDDSFLQWRTYTEQYKAAERKLDYEVKAGKYVKKSEVERLGFKIGRQLRDDILNIPARFAAVIAAKSKKKEKEVYQLLRKEANIILRDIQKNIAKIGTLK
jgi:hypothetical protein